MRLRRTTQCEKCPWKRETNPYDIPGYELEKHKALRQTIADPDSFDLGKVIAFSCHESNEGDDYFCVGWLHNQLGQGNNIPLLIHMLSYENAKDIRVIGEQHERFEDTLPKCPNMSKNQNESA